MKDHPTKTESIESTNLVSGFAGLSGRLLILTIVFVMIAEVLIWAPSIARYRKATLEGHMARAHLAALALQSSRTNLISEDLEKLLLFHAEARGIILKSDTKRMMMLLGRMPPEPDVTVNLDTTTWYQWLTGAFDTFGRSDNRVIRVMGMSPKDPGTQVEVLIDETPLRAQMVQFSTRILQLSLVISVFTALLVFFSLHRLVVRPVRNMTRAMIRFREAPEDPTRIIAQDTRKDEVGQARRELAIMQRDVQAAIDQQTRLATLGAAMAKINHDLRNSLATAVLAMEKIAVIEDPDVKEATPRLYRAIDRAVSLCSQTLNYISDEKPAFEPVWFHLSELVAEVAAGLRDSEVGQNAALHNRVGFEFDLEADRGQIYRAIFNLVMNATQAGATAVDVSAVLDDDHALIRIADDGPGLPQKAVDKMFQPFAGSARQGGVGLGLVIVRDALQAHGGTITVEKTGPEGTTFLLRLPVMRPGSSRPDIERDIDDNEI